jgi:hypothetical protein
MANPYDILFLALAPALALASLRLKRRSVLVTAVVIAGLVGYWLEFRSEAWSDAQIAAQFEAIPNPSNKQIEEFNADGASKAAVAILGLPVSLAYSTLCFLLVHGGRRFLVRVNRV